MTKNSPGRGWLAAASLVVFAFAATFASSHSGRVIEQTTNLARVTNVISSPQIDSSAFSSGDNYLPDVCKQGTYQWPVSRLPIKVFISDGQNAAGYRPQFNDYIRNSFSQWCQASGNKLSWTEVSDRSKADITVDWTTQVKQIATGTEAGETNALTRLNTTTHQGIIFGARMHFLTALNGVPFSDTEMQRTCLHESGHALGLQGHSPERGDVMYYAIAKNQAPVLSTRDRETMAELYASVPASDEIALGQKRQ